MLLFSTILEINDSMTKDAFVGPMSRFSAS